MNQSSIAKAPVLFDEFFEMGQAETLSPFITKNTRHLSANLTLKAACLATALLLISFLLSRTTEYVPLSHALLLLVYFLAGIPALIESVEDLLAGEINIDILMTLAAFSSVFIGSGMEGGLLLVLFAISGSMEDAVTAKAKNALSSLHRLSPTKACVINEDGSLIEKAISDITVGTLLLVKSGEVVPLDGVVTKGSSSLNLVHLTGENLPVTKTVADEVPAGARNLEGAFTMQVKRTNADSTLAKIIQLVTNAQEAKPRLQRWFDSLSRAYATGIISLSAFFSIALHFILDIPFLGEEGSLYRALAFLIAASPCALIIAIPIAYLSAISSCAKHGILLKGGVTLDALASCKKIAFDKTGTLTTGELVCLGVESLEALPENSKEKILSEALGVAYAFERNAVHPIAKGILSYSEAQKAPTIDMNDDFKTIPGYGLEGSFNEAAKKKNVRIGNLAFILQNLSEDQKKRLLARADTIHSAGEIAAFLMIDEKIFIFRFRDTPRPGMSETLKKLKAINLESLMLTGDQEKSAKAIAGELGLDRFEANLKPEDKLLRVQEIASKEGLAMVGDGINDAPALARATVGICMGKIGSKTAVDAADVILLNDNIEKLAWLFEKARLTVKIVKQNLCIAVGAILIASIPALAGIIPLWLAVVMHEGGTVLVGLNALRLLR